MEQKIRFKSIPEIASMFRTANGERVSEKLIRRRCCQNGVHNYVEVSKPYLSQEHLASRLNWATTKRNWSAYDWGNVMFSDESLFTVRPTKVSRYV